MNGRRAPFLVSFARNREANDKSEIRQARLLFSAFAVCAVIRYSWIPRFLKSFHSRGHTSWISFRPPSLRRIHVLLTTRAFREESEIFKTLATIAALCRREIVKLENAVVIALSAIALHSYDAEITFAKLRETSRCGLRLVASEIEKSGRRCISSETRPRETGELPADLQS